MAAAAAYWGVPPWELLERPVAWTLIAHQMLMLDAAAQARASKK